jgi:hypothetical protein
MKKVLISSIVLLTILLSIGPASAWQRHHSHHSHFRMYIGPPVIWTPPPVYYRYSYPPYDYFYDRGYRVWIPGYWDYRWTPYSWRRVWIPGRWEWR